METIVQAVYIMVGPVGFQPTNIVVRTRWISFCAEGLVVLFAEDSVKQQITT